ncbi:MAG: helix-turn-helix domain-containing protein, partial [Conexivisphaerales archaeon]
IMMRYGEVCACELQPALGLPQPTITAHLHKMHYVDLVKVKEVWKYSYYYINEKYLPLVRNILKTEYSQPPTSKRRLEVV